MSPKKAAKTAKSMKSGKGFKPGKAAKPGRFASVAAGAKAEKSARLKEDAKAGKSAKLKKDAKALKAEKSEKGGKAGKTPKLPKDTRPAKSLKMLKLAPRALEETTERPFFNRELSWLEFDRRVLEEAFDASIPLLERLKFMAISASNLDEFFMVRVGGLHQLRRIGGGGLDGSGMTVEQQLQAVIGRVRQVVEEQYACFLKELAPRLESSGLRRLTIGQLISEQLEYLERTFENELYPVITPMAVADAADFPLLPGLGLNLAVRLKAAPAIAPGSAVAGESVVTEASAEASSVELPNGSESEGSNSASPYRFAVIPLPRRLPRFITLPGEQGYQYVLLEDVITAYIDNLFPGEPILETIPFRITRNADFSVVEDQASDFVEEMKEVLIARKRGQCVRLELDKRASRATRRFLLEALEITENEVFAVPGPLQLSAYMALAGRPGFEQLKYEPWPPQPSPDIKPGDTLLESVGRRDLLLFHPYQSFEPVVRLIEEASDDPDVLAIKQILYRTSEKSPIVAALARAAAKDKHVTVLVELKARFDEARNIEWAEALERAGVQVIYGLRGLKTHAKICIIVRREPNGIRRYVHFGTGNYNEQTARLYSDLSLMTVDEDLGADASAFFNAITGYSQPVRYQKIAAAPTGLRAKLLDLIESETERSRQGQKARISAKMNSLVDTAIIKALYRASQAGVKIELNVRGICCLRPGVKGLSDNIRVVSIVDRFLEHARIVYFHHGGDGLTFISSADWMPRNLDRRVELLVPVEASHCRDLVLEILESSFRDNVKGRELQPDGSYKRLKPGRGKGIRSQEALAERAREMYRQARKRQHDEFEPQRPKK